MSAPEPGPDAPLDSPANPPDTRSDSTGPATGTWLSACRKNLADSGLGVNGQVSSIAIGDDETVYLGGNFTWVGPLTGGGVPFILPEGQPATSFARVAGVVSAVAPDGLGGWFIGGYFDHVDDLARRNLAHIRSDGSADAAFQADADGTVKAIAVMGDRIYVGGQFDTLGGVPRKHLGLLDWHGSVAPWNPGVTAAPDSTGYANPSVDALLVLDGKLYVGGGFTEIGSASRGNLAVFEADGALGAWNPMVGRSIALSGGGAVKTIASDGASIWIGGEFDTVSGIDHRAIAAFDASGNLRSWDPRLDELDTVSALAAAPEVLYIGGDITTTRSGGTLRQHSGLVAVDRSGRVLDWNPSVTYEPWNSDGPIEALALVDDRLFVGGSFISINGNPRSGLAALDRNGRLLDWDPSADEVVHDLAVQGNAIYAGGVFTTLCGERRNNLAAIDRSGRLLNFNPDVGNYVQEVALHQGSLLVGGGFVTIGGKDQHLLAEVGLSNGRPTAFAPVFENGGWVSSIQPFGGAIYIGGGFTSVNGTRVSGLAALALDGTLSLRLPATDWGRGGPLAVLGDVLYVAGTRGSEGTGAGQLLAFARDGSPKAWSADADRAIWTLASDENEGRLYAGGSFTKIAGAERPMLAAFDRSGALLPWIPAFDEPPWWIDVMATLDDIVLVSGVTKPAPNELRGLLRAFDKQGKPTAWNPEPNAGVSCMVVHDRALYIGGGFSFIAGRLVGGFAKLDWFGSSQDAGR